MDPFTIAGLAMGGGSLLAGLFSKPKKVQYQALDINKVINEARTTASQNLENSIGLEAKFRPGTAALRRTTDDVLGNIASGNTAGFAARDRMAADFFGSGGTNDLLAESTNRILGQLRLGGQLDPETQNAVMRGALEGSGTAGISGSGAGRGLVARDLGLTSLGLMQQRQANALNAGQILQNSQLSALNAGTALAGQDLQRGGLLAGIIDARAMPESGLSPDSVANMYVADNNARNQVNATNAQIAAQSRNQMLQGMLGFGGSLMTAGAAGGISSALGKLGGSTALPAGMKF